MSAHSALQYGEDANLRALKSFLVASKHVRTWLWRRRRLHLPWLLTIPTSLRKVLDKGGQASLTFLQNEQKLKRLLDSCFARTTNPHIGTIFDFGRFSQGCTTLLAPVQQGLKPNLSNLSHAAFLKAALNRTSRPR